MTTSLFSRLTYRSGEIAREKWVRERAREVPRDAVVLDVGAGPCTWRPLFQHCTYQTQDFVQYEGRDTGLLADKRFWRYGKIDYRCDATAIPVPDATFDAVVCTEVLEHVPDPEKVVAEISRLLKDGGRLILSAPLGSGLHQEPFHFFGGFTPYWYSRALTSYEFDEITVSANGGFFRHFGQESARFVTLLDPRRHGTGRRLLVAPLWLLSFPVFRVMIPLLCCLLDPLDRERGFTVGYHVTARRRRRQLTLPAACD